MAEVVVLSLRFLSDPEFSRSLLFPFGGFRSKQDAEIRHLEVRKMDIVSGTE